MQEDVVKKMIASLKCSACGKGYQEAGIDIIEHKEEIWFLKVNCPACHVRSLVAAIIREEAAPLVTDLTAGETARFRDAGAVGEQDLLEMHTFLKDFSGDVTGLLE